MAVEALLTVFFYDNNHCIQLVLSGEKQNIEFKFLFQFPNYSDPVIKKKIKLNYELKQKVLSLTPIG